MHKFVTQLVCTDIFMITAKKKKVPWMFKNLKIYAAFWFHLDPHHQPLLLFGEEAVLGKLRLKMRTTWSEIPWCCNIWASVPGEAGKPCSGHSTSKALSSCFHPPSWWKGTFMFIALLQETPRKTFWAQQQKYNSIQTAAFSLIHSSWSQWEKMQLMSN